MNPISGFCSLFGPLTRMRDPDYIGPNLDSKASDDDDEDEWQKEGHS